MYHSQINVRYAKSLFLLAKEKKMVDEIRNDVDLIYQSLDEIPEITVLLEHPVIKTIRKKAVLTDLFAKKINNHTLSFLYLILKNKRENHLKGILRNYIDIYRDYKNIKTADITTAYELSDKEKKNIIAAIEKKFNATIDLNANVNKELIGGLIIQVDNKQLDLSVANYLNNLKSKFFDFEINYKKNKNQLK